MNFIRRLLKSEGKNRFVWSALICSLALSFLTTTCLANDFRLRLHQLKSTSLSHDDIQTELRFGREVAARILSSEKLVQQPELENYVNLVGASLAMNVKRSEISYYFAILDSDEIGAFSAPGGYVFITLGLLKLAQNEAELAAVLAHELAHINLLHIVNELNIRATNREELSGMARFIGASGTTTQVAFSQAVDKAISLLFESGFKKEQELAADQTAVDILALSGYDPAALEQVLERIRLQDANKNSRTHPAFKKRFQRLEAYLSKLHIQSSEFNLGQTRFRQTLSRE